MRYEIVKNVERRHYNRLKALIELGEFKGIRLKNHPTGAKRNDNIPVANEKFDNGTMLGISLRSDRKEYFFELNLTRADKSNQRYTLQTFPTYIDKNEEIAVFTVYDDVTAATYQVYLTPVPNKVYQISVTCDRTDGLIEDNIVLYYGPEIGIPEITSAYIIPALSDALLNRYDGNMRAIGTFLTNMQELTVEEFASQQAAHWSKRKSMSIKPYAKSILDEIEQKSGWQYVREIITENDQVIANQQN